MAEDLVQDVPGTVQAEVRDVVTDWKRRHGVEMSPEAIESLGLQMMGIVGDCIRAVLKHPERFKEVSVSG